MCAESSTLLIMDLNIIVNKSIKRTEDLLGLLKKVKLQKEIYLDIPTSIIFSDDERDILYTKIENLNSKYIYVFTIENWKDHILEIKGAYEGFNKENKPRIPGQIHNISRYNKDRNSKTLYVGSSKDIRSRIKQHLGDGNKRTYSLDLVYWLPNGIDLTLEIFSLNLQDQNVIETVEQEIWDELKPLFGKRSSQ